MERRLHAEFVAAPLSGSRRLTVVLHGLGDSLEGYRWLPDELAMPDMNYLLVNGPDPYFNGYAWYDLTGDPAPGVRRSRELLGRLLDEQVASGFSTKEMFLFGFSQGCLMTLDIGLRYPEVLAGLVGVSGYVHEPDSLLQELSPVAQRQRILLTHGTLDPLIPIEKVRPQVRKLQAAGLQITWHEFSKAHTIAGSTELAVLREFMA